MWSFSSIFLVLVSPTILVTVVYHRRRSAAPVNFDDAENENENEVENDYHHPKSYISRISALLGVAALFLLYASIFELRLYDSSLFSPKFNIDTQPSDKEIGKIKDNGDRCTNMVSSYSPQSLVGLYGDMSGQYHRHISSTSNLTQVLFDQGLLHTYGFNLVEGIRNFQAALSVEPNCAMCYWGIAYANGPNINTDMSELMAENGKSAILSAFKIISSDHTSSVSDADIALIHAQMEMFSFPSGDEWKKNKGVSYDQIFLDAMKKNYETFPDDMDIATIYAESILNLSPWSYYKPIKLPDDHNSESEPPVLELKEEMKVALAVLRTVLDKSPSHPLALHLWIHVTESGSFPSKGEKEADSLAALAIHGTGTSHLLHMPAHIYLRVGRYYDAIMSSVIAIRSDNLYLERCLVPYVPLHNIAMLVSASLFSGDFVRALEYTPFISTTMPAMAAVDLPALFPTPRDIILARMGHWNEIIELFPGTSHSAVQREGVRSAKSALLSRRPQLGLLRSGTNGVERALESNSIPKLASDVSSAAPLTVPPYVRATQIYSQALAHTGLNNLVTAEELLLELTSTVSNIPYDELPIEHPFYAYHHQIGELFLGVAKSALLVKKSEKADDQGDGMKQAIGEMKAAVALQSTFSYMEPEHFYFPTRHCLGALLLRAWDRAPPTNTAAREALIAEAIDVYDADLREHPNNIWALKGLEIAYGFSSERRVAKDPGSAIERDAEDQRISGVTEKMNVLKPIKESAFEHTPEEFKNIQGSCCELSLC